MSTGKAVTIKKDLRQLYYELGLALLEQNDFQTAINQLSDALSAEGSETAEWQIHHLLGRAYASLKFRVMAAEHRLRAVAGCPHPPAEWFKETASIIDRSTAILKKDWLMNEFRKSLEGKKLDTAAQDHCQLLLAQIAIHLDDGELADTMLNRVAESNTQVIMYRGEAALLLGNTPGAIQNFEAAQAAFAKNGDQINAEAAKICLARAEAETGNYAAAFRLTSDLKNILPNHLHHVRLIDGYFFLSSGKSGDVQNCISQLRLTENRPDEANLLETRLLLSQKEYARAAEVANYAAAQTAQPWLRQEFNYLRSRALMESNTDVDGGISILKQLQKENAPLAYFKDRDRCAALDGNGNYSFFLAVFASEILADQAEALVAMSKAASGGVTGGDSRLTEAIVLERMLQCQELTRATPGDRAETCYRIGIYHYNTSQYNEAVNWLRKSLGTKAIMKTRWYLIDSLFLDSSLSEPPYIDQNKIAEAEQLWEQSITLEHPDEQFPWAYLLMARIMDSKSKLPGVEIYDCYREAWAYAEMATLLQPERYLAWSFIGKFQRLLSLYVNARMSLEKGMELNADDHYLIEDMAGVYLDSAEFDKAEALLRELKSRTNDVFYEGWLGFSYYNQHRFDEAIPQFLARVENNNNDFWSRMYLMWCYWFKDQKEETEAQAKWVWDHREAATTDQLDTVAGAALILRKLDEATQLYQNLTSNSDYLASGRYGLLICYLVSGKLNGLPKLVDELKEAGFDARQFRVAEFELKHIASLSSKENWKHGPELRQLINDEKTGLLTQISNLIDELESREETVFEELNRQMKVDQYDKEGSWGWVACRAAKARLLLQENRMKEAIDVYAQLLPYKDQFHPLKSGIDWVVKNFKEHFPPPPALTAEEKK